MSADNLLQVGDKLHLETFMGANWYKITRVTKTLAISKRKSDGHEYKFKRHISCNMAQPYRQWNTVKYTVENLLNNRLCGRRNINEQQ